MSIWLKRQLRRSRGLYAWLRASKYALWQVPVLHRLVPLPAEIEQLEQIVGRSRAQDLHPPAAGEQRVLVFIPRGWSVHVARDLLVAHGLRLRGVDVRTYTCGGRLPICNIASHHAAPPMPCAFCRTYTSRMFAAIGFAPHRLRDFIRGDEIAAVRRCVAGLHQQDFGEFEDAGLPIGRLVQTSVRWFLNSGIIGDDPLSLQVYRDFLASGAIVGRVARRLLHEVVPDVVYLLNGLFFEEQILTRLAREQGVEVITHENGFLADSEVLARNTIASHYDLSRAWPHFATRPLGAQERAQLDAYLKARWRGGLDTARYYPRIEADTDLLLRTLRLDASRPIVTAFTNILWDSAVLDRHRAFPGMTEWLAAIVERAAHRPDRQLVIRVHPAEVRLELRETRQRAGDFIRAKFPVLPPNVRLIPPESPLSSYALMRLSKAGLVYTSTVGLEMALQGKPVLVAGQTHYADKGFTYEACTASEYLTLLDQIDDLPLPSPDAVELARRYAHLFFLRMMVRFPLVTTLERGRLRFDLEDLSALRPGVDPGLDLICEGIQRPRPFLVGSLPPEVVEAYGGT